MIRALGTSLDRFDPNDPGRLCRRRERWLEALPAPDAPVLYRFVATGAAFSDAGAHDAKRGLSWSGVDAGTVVDAAFPDAPLLAFAWSGDPRTVPAGTVFEEDWTRPLVGGARRVPAVRWIAPCRRDQVAAWTAGTDAEGYAGPRADGFLVKAWPKAPDERATLIARLHALVGFSLDEAPPVQRYAATALPALLDLTEAVVLVHEDKHAPAVGIYTRDPVDADAALEAAARAAGALNVPFDIPPMLARWDRALWELQQRWDTARDGEFPVPPVEDARRRRGRGRDDASVGTLDAAPEAPPTEVGGEE